MEKRRQNYMGRYIVSESKSALLECSRITQKPEFFTIGVNCFDVVLQAIY